MTEPSPPQDDAALLRFVERFGLALSEAGLPRMAARVFAYILAEDSDRYTAAELAEGLGVSRAAISTATRVLVDGGFVGREREPGSRVDSYRVYDTDIWQAINRQRMPILQRFMQALDEGLDLIGSESRGGRRILETQAYLRYMGERFSLIADEWHEVRDDYVARVLADRSD